MFRQCALKHLSRLCFSILIVLGIEGCSHNHNNVPLSTHAEPVTPSSSFASSSVCTSNAFLQKYQCSFTRISQAARAGDPDAQYALGYLYYYGIGATQDRQTGLVWIRKAASQGQPVAQQALKALSTNQPVPKKVPVAIPNQSDVNTVPVATSSNPNPGPGAPETPPTTPPPAEKPLTEYLPNYGEKRIDSTTTPPPAVNLSSPGVNP